MIPRLLTALIFFLCTILSLKGQPFPADYFIPPLDGVLQVSGTFAELRGGHFHSGVDFRTNSREGMPVKAVADGYVVRIKISAIGFGKAIYINHPNGFTSVYAHMQGFDERISDWIRARQYEKESFEVDLFPPKDLLRVTKGEIIGRSGNSGSSEGPHLHFELRETDTELPVDPLLFGLPVKDWIRPTMHGLRIYPEGQGSLVNDKSEPVTLELAGWGPVYRLKINDTVHVAGNFSLGISASDLLNETSNRNGVNDYEVYIDSILKFHWKAVKFSFSETRYINSFIDYPQYYETNRRFMRTHVDPGNRLSMYAYVPDGGVFKILHGELHQLKVVLKDSKQNESILQFIVKSSPFAVKSDVNTQLRADISGKELYVKPAADNRQGMLFSYLKPNVFSTPAVRNVSIHT
ncbi:MAG TPA: M23 family metallopeptidase [Bacteroidales bacterium]|nr:M23 family metallopeptidase [Bacteroidales bacterium]